MKKVPMVMQMEAVECGAASLSMILAYFGKWLPLEQVREACSVSRDGSSMKNILLAAKTYGLDPSAYKVSAEELAGMEPAIIHWNFEHFVVFKGMRKGKAYLNDPGIGPVEIPMDEFRRSFTGVAMTFELTDRFQPSGRPTSIFSYIRHNLRGANEAFWLTFIFTLLLAVVTLTLPLLTRVFFDEILSGRNAQWATAFFCLMAALALFNFIVTLLQQRYSKRIAGQLALRGNIDYLRHLLRLPMNFFAMRYVGDLQQRQRLNETITHSLVEVLAPQAINVMLLVLYLILMLSYNYMLTMIGVVAALVNLAVVHYYAGKRLNMVRSIQQSMGKYYSATVSCMENIESIKAAGAEEGFFQYWSGLWTRMFNKQREMRIQQSEMSLLPTLTSNLLTMAVLLVGAWYILQGDLSVGMLMAFQGFMTAFMAPVEKIVNAGQQLLEMRSQIERVDDVMKYPEDRHADGEHSETGKLLGELELRDVTFGYNRTMPPLIEHFNLHLRAGESVAFVGSSGCGKSTLAKLISGLYKPWSGEILFDGRPIETISSDELTNSIAVVDQNIVLFDDTLSQNIRMWDQSIEDFAILMACSDAQVHSDIMNRPEGLATKVVRGGKNFSGGQCQRFEIATALAREPMILIMDEATSALDPTTEDLVMKHIRELGITQIVVAHRLSTIRDCDQIVVMDNGHVIQRGNHEQLLQQDGLYRQLMENG
jgi:NHLM bacteriocin system ABC transporter peptidase/ATP-binding protein